LRGGAPPNHAFCAGQIGRAAEPVDAASDARSFDAATDPGDQCLAGAYGRARHDGCTRERRAPGVAGIIAGAADERLPAEAHASLIVLAAELQAMRTLIASIEKRIIAHHRSDEASKRLRSIPGIGLVGATAIVATITDPKAFRSGRDMAAWIGLVPRQDSTGGKQKLGPISKQGDRYLRRILVVGAHAVLKLARQKPEKYPWLTQLLARKPFKVVAVALANKMARIAWALLVKGGPYRARALVAAA